MNENIDERDEQGPPYLVGVTDDFPGGNDDDLTEWAFERGIEYQKWHSKPKRVTTVAELDALPAGTIIACVKVNPNYPSVFLHCGPTRAPWLHLDPSDREDGESTMPSGEVLQWYGNGSVTVLHEASL